MYTYLVSSLSFVDITSTQHIMKFYYNCRILQSLFQKSGCNLCETQSIDKISQYLILFISRTYIIKFVKVFKAIHLCNYSV